MFQNQLLYEKNRVLQVRNSKITAPKTTKQRWQTYISHDDGSRQKVSATTETLLIDKLYDFYYANQVPTLTEFFENWLDKRRSENLSYKSIRRYVNYWDKYYASHDISQKRLNRISTSHLEDFFHEAIKRYNMTVKELNNMKFIVKDMLKFAMKSNLIKINPFLDADIKTYACSPPPNHHARTRVYLPDEKEAMFKALNEEISKYPDSTDPHGIFLLFTKGIRIGELSALKLEDVDFDQKELFIHRMEKIVEDEKGNAYNTVVNYNKKRSPYGIRRLPLTDDDIYLIDEVIRINKEFGFSDQNFLFVDKDGRTKNREFDNRIRKMCAKIGIKAKSAHDIRRTVASEMNSNNISIEVIRDYLGHSDITTTYNYIYDNNAVQKTRELITESLKNMHGLKRTQK